MISKSKKKARSERIIFGAIVICMMGGVGLCLSSLLIPNWALDTWTEGIVIVTSRIGLWHNEMCDYKGCRRVFVTDHHYFDQKQATFESRDLIRVVETVGVFISIVSLGMLIPLWTTRHSSSWGARSFTQIAFFSSSLIAAILCLAGPLILSSKIPSEHVDFAPFLVCGGSALMFLAAIMSGFHCRFDPRGTHIPEKIKEYVIEVTADQYKKEPLP